MDAACAPGREGDPCDDHDACTVDDICRDATCRGVASFEGCDLATSLDYGTTQGARGWFYGFWTDPAGSAAYRADAVVDMEYCESREVWTPAGRCVESGEPGFQWTYVGGHGLQHPDARPVLEIPVRRWVSPVAGLVRISTYHSVNAATSDGTTALLFLNGDEIWRHRAGTGGEAEDSIEIELAVGDRLDQAVHPHDDDAGDTTEFVIEVTGIPPDGP